MAFKKRWTSKRDAMGSAIGCHACISCRYHQPSTFDACPSCKAKDTRVYFPSRAEHVRAAHLLLQRDLGKISRLEFHPRFDLVVDGVKVTTYVADAQYYRDGKLVIEDTKPPGEFIDKTAELKISLFNALFAKHNTAVTIYRST